MRWLLNKIAWKSIVYWDKIDKFNYFILHNSLQLCHKSTMNENGTSLSVLVDFFFLVV